MCRGRGPAILNSDKTISSTKLHIAMCWEISMFVPGDGAEKKGGKKKKKCAIITYDNEQQLMVKNNNK
jgi:hypothetical protein